MDKKTTNQLAQKETITDQELADRITMDYFSKWCKGLDTKEGKADADHDRNYFCALYPQAKPNSAAAMNYTAFAGGLASGMNLAEEFERIAEENTENPAQIKTALKRTIARIDNPRYLMALLKMAEELAKPDDSEAEQKGV